MAAAVASGAEATHVCRQSINLNHTHCTLTSAFAAESLLNTNAGTENAGEASGVPLDI